MYQAYPSGSGPEQVQDRPREPRTVASAVKLMYAGAVISAVEIVVSLATIGGLKAAIVKAYPHDSAAQVHNVEVAAIAGLVVSGLIGVGLWVLMARLNGAGRNWARIMASVLFGINTIELIATFARPHALLGVVFPILLWLVGLGAIMLLWRRESSAFFQPARPDA